ncbi:MFS transporter [Vibrio sp. S4M6]|uniref:MFS transporter n=1 Tax=Vibrio sinus TaxID=2946865 RepID=UPI00202A73AA|nr:MFS transporter [Vibrio sinus]MCL9779952.1 MFS transporter [Vibrio sinus]
MSGLGLTIRFGFQQYLHWFTTGLMVPVTVLAFQARGLNLSEVGVLMAIWIGTTTVLDIPLGRFADTFGRKHTYLISLVVSILGYSVFYVSSGFTELAISVCLLGMSRAVYTGTLDAWFYDAFKNTSGNRTYFSCLALVNVMTTLGLATGSLIGGQVAKYSSYIPFIDHSGNYEGNILLVLVLTIGLIIVSAVLIDEQKPSKRLGNATKDKHTLVSVLDSTCKNGVLKRMFPTILVFGITLSSVENLWQPYLASLYGSSKDALPFYGLVSALYFLVSALSSVASIYVLRLFGNSHKQLMISSRLLAGITLALLANTSGVSAFLVYYLAFFFLFTLGNNSEKILVNDNTDARYLSTMQSVSSFVMNLGGVIASVGFGFISEHYGIGFSWLSCSIILSLSAFFFVSMPESYKSSLRTGPSH